jgi:hypothetical protein
MERLYIVTAKSDEIVETIFFLYLFNVHAFPNNMLWLDFSPLSCCCIYGVCTRGVQILRTKRSSCGMPSRIQHELSSVNSILAMIRYVVEYEL